MEFIDTHTHLSDPAFKGEEDAAVQRALQAGVRKMMLADVDSRERQAMHELAARHPGVLYPMAGLYPGSVDSRWQEELDLVYRAASGPEIVAIGEIGLDYHWPTDFKVQQQEALKAQLELAARLDLPVNIHMRDATEDFFKVLDSCRGLALRGNLHAFSGSKEVASRIRRYGDWCVGIGGVLTFKNAGIAREVEDIPLEMIVLETDSPYLAPTPLRGTRNESANIPLIAAKLAEIKGVSIEHTALITSSNAKRLFTRIDNG